MNLEVTLIKLILKRENLTKYIDLLRDLNLSQDTKILLLLAEKYYKKFEEHNYISPDEFIHFYQLNYPNEKEPERITQLIQIAAQIEVSDSLAADLIRRLLARNFAFSTIGHLMPLSEGRGEIDDLYKLPEMLDEFKELLHQQDVVNDPWMDSKPDVLFDFDPLTDGLLWPITKLNQTVGPLPGATLGHIFARVETGKTTFISHVLTNWARQLAARNDEKFVIGVFNEERGKAIVARTYHSLLDMTSEECRAYVQTGRGEELEEMYREAGGSHLRVIHDTGMSLERLVEIFETYPIRGMVGDIADHFKYKGCDKDNEERRLNQVYRRLREFADRYECDILSCGQAGDLASGKKRLLLEHMFHSRTAKPGALDYAIGIGASYDPAEEDFRWLNVCKNKLQATGFIQIPVRIDRHRGRYHDL